MQRLFNLLVKLIIGGRNLRLQDERARVGIIAAWISIAVNLVLSLLKLFFGLAAGSVSLMADAAHTASDISSSLVVLIGFRISRRGPDREHPFGHGRIEYLAGLAIALMLLAVGCSFAYTAYQRLASGTVLQPSLLAVVVAAASIIIKEALYRLTIRLGRLIDSEALIADAWHHRSDSFTSIAVLFALLGSFVNLGILDAIFGFVVSAFVIYTGIAIARRSVNRLLGTAPAPEIKEDIINSALAIGGVLDAHDLEVHDYGARKSVTLHIEVDGELSLTQAHQIARLVEIKIKKAFHCSAVVHLDPCASPAEPVYQKPTRQTGSHLPGKL